MLAPPQTEFAILIFLCESAQKCIISHKIVKKNLSDPYVYQSQLLDLPLLLVGWVGGHQSECPTPLSASILAYVCMPITLLKSKLQSSNHFETPT